MPFTETLTTLHHERSVLADAFSPAPWLSYIAHLRSVGSAAVPALFVVHEHSVAAMPGSYKLWMLYVDTADGFASAQHPDHPSRLHALDVGLRAARALPHCPVAWERLVRRTVAEGRWTRVRGIVDEAVRGLPVTLHARFWRVVLKEVLGEDGGKDSVKDIGEDGGEGGGERFLDLGVHFMERARMLRVGGDGAVEMFRVLRDLGRFDEAVLVLAEVLQANGAFGGDDRRRLWMELVEVAAKHSGKCPSTDVVQLIRGGIERAEAEVGEMWVALSGVHARLGRFKEAKEVYEEALVGVVAVRDFAFVFDSYAKFMEALLVAAMEVDPEDSDSEGESEEESEESGDAGKEGLAGEANECRGGKNGGAGKAVGESKAEDGDVAKRSDSDVLSSADEFGADTLMDDLEALTKRRPILLSNVWLRQNPHNVHEWHKRAGILKRSGDIAGAVNVYTESVRTVDPWRASHGRPHTLWLAFANLYENAKHLDSARKVLDKAVSDPEKFQHMEDLAAIWCEYAEMELRHGLADRAREIMRRATSKPKGFDSRKIRKRSQGHLTEKGAFEYDLSSPAWLSWKSLQVWSLFADLEESFGSPDDVQTVHETMLEIKTATVQTVVNGAAYFEAKRLFEKSFRLFDRACTALAWPDSLRLWLTYLKKFVKRFAASKLERTRDLFEEALKASPVKHKGTDHPELDENVRLIYLMYAAMEETHGLARHAMSVYERAAQAVLPKQQASIYRLYIVRAAEFFGATRTRTIYEQAIESLVRREDVMEFSLRYAKMEARLGEIDRARGVFAHGAEVADPRSGPQFAAYWTAWNTFELEHGSEDTFRDMLRVKRSVQMQNADVHLMTSVAAGAGTIEAAAAAESERKVAAAAAAAAGDPSSADGDGDVGAGAMAALEKKVLQAQAAAAGWVSIEKESGNDEEIDIGLSDSGSDVDSEVRSQVSGRRSAENIDLEGDVTTDKESAKTTDLTLEAQPIPAAVLSIAGLQAQPGSENGNEKKEMSGLKRKPEVENDGSLPAKKPLGALERLKRSRRT